jgi:hypothetical protein
MLKKTFFLISLVVATGCIRETYDMDKLSKQAHLSPTLAISAIRGDVSISDLMDPNDTVVFDEDNFIRIVFKKDSVISFRMEDYYDLNDMVSFSETYEMGDISITAFSDIIDFTLDKISQKLSPELRAQFLAMDGTTSTFPPFPVTTMDEVTYSVFTNFEYAVFREGIIDITVRNNLPAPVSGIKISLYNAVDHTPVGGEGTIAMIDPGQIGRTSIDIANVTIRNSITAAVTINGSPGSGSPVPIDLDVNKVEVSIAGRDLLVKSGRVVVPIQNVSVVGDDNIDTITFDPGTGIEVTVIKMNAGNISYSIVSGSPLTSDVSLSFPTALRFGVPVTESLTVNPFSTLNGNIMVDNSIIDLGTISTQPYNLLPVEQNITISSNGNMVNFNSTDEVTVILELLNPDFDYVKGFFGQETEYIEPDTLDLDIKDILRKISGDFLLSSPSVKLNYSNSFALPVEVDLLATGFKADETLDLGMDPFTLSYPAAPDERDKTGVFTIDKTNSTLPELVSMPPEIIRFSGSAKMNPQGNTGSRDNYVFGDSRFIGSLEIEIPMELRMTSLQFADTVDNFLQLEDSEDGNPVDPDDFEFLRIDINAENGFPVGVSLSIILYDSVAGVNRSTVDAENILEPAPVDINGRVTNPVECNTSIEITREFWDSVDLSDKIIFKFTMNTTDNGSKDVKIYSDYKINFNASLVLKPDLKFDLK